MRELEKLNEGKTKIIWSTDNPELVLIESKDDITAGDGVKRDFILGKGGMATETTVNCFKLLTANGIPNHFVDRYSENIFLAQKVDMIPLESVARRIATGSYLQRNPKVKEGTVFRKLRTELFFKDDKKHDPLVEYNMQRGEWEVFDAHLAKNAESLISTYDALWLNEVLFEVYRMTYYTKQVFEVLEKAWQKQDVTLADLKIEFGFNSERRLIVADVIDNDSWRIWPGGDKKRMLDKQRYREGADLESVKLDYQKVAKLTRNFCKD